MRRVIGDVCLEDEEIEGNLREFANMFGRNQLGFQHRRCICERVCVDLRGDEL